MQIYQDSTLNQDIIHHGNVQFEQRKLALIDDPHKPNKKRCIKFRVLAKSHYGQSAGIIIHTCPRYSRV